MIKETKHLYALWLPITDFDEICTTLYQKKYLKKSTPNSNINWFWLTFPYEESIITIDSLGFIFIDNIGKESLTQILIFLVSILNERSKQNITDTFLNKSPTDSSLIKFLETITISFSSITNSIKCEYIQFNLNAGGKEFFHQDRVKFSMDKIDEESQSFYTILNRNFENVLKKSIFFTHGLQLEEGEIYPLSINQTIYKKIKESVPSLKIVINKKEREEERDALLEKVIKKILQDTIEERIILNFLHKTKVKYLSKIINEIAINGDRLKKLNSYLLDEITQKEQKDFHEIRDLDDESATEIFIQNLLQITPKFYRIDTKIQEAYYVKVGNTTTNLRVDREETILETLYYKKWKDSIDFFFQTATKAKESLNMYHQNKTLKELENISYNANYQADIEDIRELKRTRAFQLDESSKRILFLIAIVTLAGEAPLITIYFNPQTTSLLDTFIIHLKEIISNFTIYSISLYLVRLIFVHKKNFPKELFNLITRVFKRKKMSQLYLFEESDYDKHEYRSNRSLYSYNKKNNAYKKIPISYNHLLSDYTLVKKLKTIYLTQKHHDNLFKFHLFPKLLREVPTDKNRTKHIYRENYRVSGNERVAIKIMYRYKIHELKLKDFLNYLEEDDFIKEYENYLKKESNPDNTISLLEAIKKLKPNKSSENKTMLTLYVVYSFQLKFNSIDRNIYNYTISKDQFRVHYHINQLDHNHQDDFQKKLEYLAVVIDIYFLKRLKRFKEVCLL